MQVLGIDLKSIDIAVLSHGHSDHTAGLAALLQANPDVRLYLPNDFFSLGTPIKFPFREAEPWIAQTLDPDERYFRGERVVEGMLTVPTGRLVGRSVEAIIRATIAVVPGPVLMVAGGFHLIPYGRTYVEDLAGRMKDVYHVRYVAPAHCTGHLGFSVLHKVFGEGYRRFGLGDTIEL